jgi:hypothetical protein
MVRPMKSFDAIFNAVVMELQRTNGAKETSAKRLAERVMR